VNAYLNESEAFVAAWLPGTEGGGIADVLFRAPDGSIPHDFSGKLSFSWPLTAQQSAVNRGDGAKPLFTYGYGLKYSDNGNLAKLPEDSGSAGATVTDTRVFFAAGKPGSGWSWVASEDTRVADVPSGVGVVGSVRMSATDHSVQEDARQIEWSGKGAASVGLASRTPISLQRETNGQLSVGFDSKVNTAPTSNVTLQMECGPGCKGAVDLTKTFSAAKPGQWSHVKVPLACFANAGARMDSVTQAFALRSAGPFGVSIANVRLETGNDALISCNP
jgi:beta-glucosidase